MREKICPISGPGNFQHPTATETQGIIAAKAALTPGTLRKGREVHPCVTFREQGLAGSKRSRPAGASLWSLDDCNLGVRPWRNWLNPTSAVCRSNPSTMQA